MLQPIYVVVDTVLNLYSWVVIVGAILTTLAGFGVINRYNQVVQVVGDFCHRLTEPVLRPIRSVVPAVGGVDLSPLVLLLGIWLVRMYLPMILT
jgi:YggT family protein